MEAGRHHSDDIESPTAQPYGMSEGVRIPTEMPCAIRTADDYRTGASFVRLVDGEPASHHGLNSENVKKLRSNGGNVRILGYGTRGHGYVIVSIVRHAFECRVLIVPIVEVGCRYISVPRPAFPERAKRDDAVGVGEGQRLQENGVHNAEHRRVRAHSQRHDQHGDRGEAGILKEHSKGESQVLEQCFKQRQTAAVTFD